ncbi:SDR family oxidoreductase [Streptomyces kanamyceticus]|uniref:SDR family oxidoreductase n=1 Tax=Streptomyces kanamyceticus TaxID=1967 RepID=A0A5J6GPC5_STRKN|nr:SDR family oxidoreductase [Streptomyces kanamyceticus]QEU95961.1 SDR family oxidoreductase [Streptomyces kanamyceticus]
MTGRFVDKVVLVTGGGRGIGRHITQAFAREGAYVVVNCFRDPDTARQTVQDVLDSGGLARLLPGNVADRGAVTALFDDVAERHGRLHVLVNNAAAGRFNAPDAVRERDWLRALSTNAAGALWCAQAARPLLERAPHAAIVNVSSSGAGCALPGYTGTGASKAALEALTRYLAVEYGPAGIRVNTASGGLIEGDARAGMPGNDRLETAARAGTPLRRLGTPEEFAQVVLFLASPAASWITGQLIHADGGLSITHPAYASMLNERA